MTTPLSAEEQVARYEAVVGACGKDTHRIDYEPRANGPFVRFESYATLLADNKRLQNDLDYCVVNHDGQLKKYREALENICRRGRCPIAEEALGI
jgi:hypothetical protein